MIPNQFIFQRLPDWFLKQYYWAPEAFQFLRASVSLQLQNPFELISKLSSLYNLTFPPFLHDQNSIPLLRYNNIPQVSKPLSFEHINPKIEEASLSLSSKSAISSPPNKKVTSMPNQTKTKSNEISLDLPNDPDICFEAQIKYMINFFVNNYGIITNEELQQARAKYEKDSKLTEVFDALQKKYSSTIKTREEMIKWIVRRSIQHSKKSIKGKEAKNQKELLTDLCKKYFTNAATGRDTCNEDEKGDEFIDSVLPFRKNSKNKTINTAFIIELFDSENYKRDYQSFLQKFDEIAEEENYEKVQRFTRVIMNGAKKGNFKSILNHKRVPWLKLWSQNTKVIAFELNEGDFIGKSSKKMKVNS